MQLFKWSLRTMRKRPFIVLYFGIIALVYSIIDIFNPVASLVMGFNRLGKGDFLEAIIYSIKMILNHINSFGVGIMVFLISTIIVVLVSIASSLLFSGYFNIINNAVRDMNKRKGEYFEGVKKYFLRLALMFVKFIFISIIFVVVIVIAAVPAIMITKSWLSGKADFTMVAAFTDVLTVGIMFLLFMFFSAYMSFWFPSIIRNGKKAFLIGKQNADKVFWKLVPRYFLFVVVFLAGHFLLAKINVYSENADLISSLKAFLAFLANWGFNTILLSFFITYVFSVFKHAEGIVEEEMEPEM